MAFVLFNAVGQSKCIKVSVRSISVYIHLVKDDIFFHFRSIKAIVWRGI